MKTATKLLPFLPSKPLLLEQKGSGKAMPMLEDQLLFYAFTDVKLFKNCGGAQPRSAAALLGKKIHDSSFCNPITLTSNLSAQFPN